MNGPYTVTTRSPTKFFLLIFALSIPFWFAGAATRRQLLPRLPVAALMFVCPATAALILVHGESGTVGMIALLKRSFDYKRIRAKIWYAPIIFLMPGVYVSSYLLMLLMGTPLPTPQLPVLATIVMLLLFFVGALGEEMGWSGYVIDPMQERWGALGAGILVGLVWAAWHIVPLLEAHRSPPWIAWWCFFTVAFRVLIVWLYNTGKSVFAAAVCHDTNNVSWQLFPIHGSYYDPRVASLIVTFVAVLVTAIWGPRTLARQLNA